MFLHAYTNGIKELLIQNFLFSLRTNKKLGLFGYRAKPDIQEIVFVT